MIDINTIEMSNRPKLIYRFVCEYFDEHGYPPSVREIAKAVNLKSPSTVHMHLCTLEEHNLIKRVANKSRTIELCNRSTQTETEPEPAQQQNLNENALSLPLVGRVAAGSPILAEENVEEYFYLPTNIVGDASTFVLKVQGDSMIEAGIYNGDYIVVAKTTDVQNGQIVVALLDDSATVKTFYKEKDCIRLQPENERMDPIYVKNPTILGRVTALIRSIR